ncbi:PAS domain-containing protein [Citrifermentans bremense]|uniref:histidine kinase n=1 Tax=Citrifermentans bremense TaxID=60035 RepID=A0A6S6LZI5_9BACT|nr:PAS domain-containing protein [Citrifermentans bremense]BCG47517.1 PAS domain-containing protein [Citrifermentans bremense]
MSAFFSNKHAGHSARKLVLWTTSVVLLVNLFLASTGFFSLWQSRETYLTNAHVQSDNLLQALSYSIAGVLDSADIAILSMVDEVQQDLRQGGIDEANLNRLLAWQHSRLPMLDSMRMADAKGDIRYGTGLLPGALKNVSQRNYFKKLAQDPQAGLVISEPIMGLISGKWVITLARRVARPDGAFAGVVYCAIDLERVRGLLLPMQIGPHGRITLTDAALAPIVRHPRGEDGGASSRDTGLIGRIGEQIARERESGSDYAASSAAGSSRLASFRKVGRFPLYLVLELAPEDFLARWRVELLQVGIMVCVFIVVTLILSRLIYLRCRRQVAAEDALNLAKEELEQRVAERTAELHLANLQLKRELAEREQAEKREREGRRMLALIIDTIPQFVFWKDRQSVYQGCNAIFARASGIAHPDDIRGKTDFDLAWLREESEAYRKDDRYVMEQNQARFHIIEQQLQAGGMRLWVDTTKVPLLNEQGEVTGVLGVYEDVSERKAIEEARDKALALVESLLAASPTGIMVYEGASGSCVMANQAMAAMLGGTQEQIRYQGFRELVLWREAGILELAEQVLCAGGTRSIEVCAKAASDKIIQAEFLLSRFEVEGRPHLMLIAVDVTTRKRLEEEKRQIEAQMLHVQKLESLGVLAGGIAHDFNNILMVVLGNADLALMRLPEVTPARENLVQIEQAATRAADLAQQMLAYSGRGNFVIQKLDLARTVKEMAQMLEVSISKKTLLQYDFAPDLPAISGDATQLRQVILNLVLNASEAIGDKNGVIGIRTCYMECDRSYLSESWIDDRLPEGPYLMLEVSDNGCGIKKEIIPKIFDPFFTTKFTGRGLGMAAVLGIVRAHNGAIKIYSEEGRGSTFRLLLPCLPAKGGEPQQQADEDLWRGSGTVLLADDEESIRGLGQEMLETLGFEVLTACDGRAAVEVFREKRDEIVCVVLDLTMPELDGEQTFAQLRELEPGVKVILSSGYNEREVSRKLAGAGVSGFMQKPYKLSEMSSKLRQILGPRAGSDQAAELGGQDPEPGPDDVSQDG